MTETLAKPPYNRRIEHAKALPIGSDSTAVAFARPPKAEAVRLLSQVVARLHGVDVPVVQFIQVSADQKQSCVARDFAEASLTRLGRTLIASLYEPEVLKPVIPLDIVGATAAGRRRTRKTVADIPDITPDSTIQGLYHARIGAGCGEISEVRPAVWLGEARLNFRLLVIDCGPLERNPAAVELASRCHGSILIVAAGATRLPQIRAAAHQVQIAGGTLLGSVFHGTTRLPSVHLPGWLPLQHLRRVLE